MVSVQGSTLVSGRAEGPVAALAPLSFWGGFDPVSGYVTDRSHPDCGLRLTGTILVMRAGRGSSSSSSVLAEAIRLGTGPAAIVLARADPVLLVGALVAATLYGRDCPVVVISADDHARLALARRLRVVAEDGRALVSDDQPSTKKNPSASSV